jgi:CRP-like cAMP-binding protein
MISSPHPALQRFLDRLLLRSALSAEEQEAVLSLPYRLTQPAARKDIVSPGQTIDHACLVARGLVARFDQMRNGARQITAFYIAGDMSDLHSVVSPTAAWGISALTGSSVLHVPHDGLRDIATRYPAIAFAFWRDSTADASVLAKWIGNIGRQDSRARLAHMLCEFGVRTELAGLGSRTAFTFSATQEQLADALGLTAVHTNRTMQRLRSEKVIATHGHQFEVLDWGRLAAIAEFDPDYLLIRRRRVEERPARAPAESSDALFANRASIA